MVNIGISETPLFERLFQPVMKPFPLKDVWLCENSLFLPDEETLVIADLQLGYEQQLRALGHNIQYEQALKMLDLLERLINELGAKRLVINGDLKHEFGKIGGQERRDILRILRNLKKTVDIVVVKGNHDTLTKKLTDIVGLSLLNSWSAGGFCCVHGHELPEKTGAHTIIMGHMHPAVMLYDGVRKEKYKCFLVGKYKGKRLIVLPSFTTITEGSDVLTVGSNTPLLKNTEGCDVYVLSDKVRPFGKLRKLRKALEGLN